MKVTSCWRGVRGLGWALVFALSAIALLYRGRSSDSVTKAAEKLVDAQAIVMGDSSAGSPAANDPWCFDRRATSRSIERHGFCAAGARREQCRFRRHHLQCAMFRFDATVTAPREHNRQESRAREKPPGRCPPRCAGTTRAATAKTSEAQHVYTAHNTSPSCSPYTRRAVLDLQSACA